METFLKESMTQFGITATLILAILIMFGWLLKWLLDTVKEERFAWKELINKLSKTIDEHTIQAREFHNNVNEAHRYQREEHKEMIQILGRMNGHK